MLKNEPFYNDCYSQNDLIVGWTTFFDEAEIPYERDAETFNVRNFGYYIPDFYLPWFNAYVFVITKEHKDMDEMNYILCEVFRSCDAAVILCVGEPLDNNMKIFCNDLTDSSSGGPNEWEVEFLEGVEGEDNGVWWSKGKHFISLVISSENDRDRDFYNRNWELLPSSIHKGRIKNYRSDFKYAKEAARKATWMSKVDSIIR